MISLALENLSVEILPAEGAVMTRLEIAGKSLLASTPWSSRVQPSDVIAADEPTWVSRWHGGWQLCAPSTGQPDSSAKYPAFHGAASQAAWTLLQASESAAEFEWTDSQLGFSLQRTWRLLPGGRVQVASKLRNLSPEEQTFGVAEHLILGGDLLRPVIEKGVTAELDYSLDSVVHELDYAGAPTGRILRGAEVGPQFRTLDRNQDARVFALSDLQSNRISLTISDWKLGIEWQGLPHALIWQEFAKSEDHPWNGEVLALGIEPTTTAHGVGSAAPGNPSIAGYAEFEWSTTLIIEQTGETNG